VTVSRKVILRQPVAAPDCHGINSINPVPSSDPVAFGPGSVFSASSIGSANEEFPVPGSVIRAIIAPDGVSETEIPLPEMMVRWLTALMMLFNASVSFLHPTETFDIVIIRRMWLYWSH
jgi:hypothetical protein